MKMGQITILFMVGSYLLLSTNPTSAQPASGSIAGNAPSPEGPADPDEVERFLDDLFSRQMEEYHFAGITAVMVKDGQVLFQKGYGYSDLGKQIPVDPAETLFRIGSVTKLFTWTAVLQLFEQGRLDLDADINTYLDFKIPDTYPEPITLKHLMSHRGGFEDRTYELGALTPDRIQPLGQYLATHLPARVYPPGQVSSYSNYGTDLAGYIVERISGMPYADYIEANILEPLEMAHTTPRQPLPSHLAAGMSKGYIYTRDGYLPQDFQLASTQSCGAISSTAEDMARFMIAHLQGGSLCPGDRGGQNNPCGSILQTATERLMQSSLWGPDLSLTGYTHGFMAWNFHGQRILHHAGDTKVFQSLLMLLPDQNLGFFVSYNTTNPSFFVDRMFFAFMDHYYPVELSTNQPAGGFASRAETYTGKYFLARSSYTTIEKVNNLNLPQWVEITHSGDGALLLGSPLSPQKARLEEIGPMLFREVTTGLQFIFQKDAQGKIAYLYDAKQPSSPFVKMPWHANPMLHYALLGACMLIFLSALCAGFIRVIVRFFKRRYGAAQSTLGRTARWIALLVALLDVSALIVFLAIFLDRNGFARIISYGQMSTINIILAAWLLAAVLAVPLAAMTVMAWRKGFWGIATRLHYALVTLAALAFVWFLNYWNLLGFRY